MDYRNLNQKIIRNPHPFLRLDETMTYMKGLQYYTALDLNMGNYTIEFFPEVAKLLLLSLNLGNPCTIGSQWGCALPLTYLKLK